MIYAAKTHLGRLDFSRYLEAGKLNKVRIYNVFAPKSVAQGPGPRTQADITTNIAGPEHFGSFFVKS